MEGMSPCTRVGKEWWVAADGPDRTCAVAWVKARTVSILVGARRRRPLSCSARTPQHRMGRK
eukprot:scaffold15822_cov108-Isochrysis_galbana.AAC.3